MLKQVRYTISVLVLGAAVSACAPMNSEVSPVFRLLGISEDHSNANAYDRGKKHLSTGYLGLAVREFQMALMENPRSIDALNGMAAVYDKMGRYDLAERYYRDALSFYPTSAQTLNNLGYSYILQGKPDLAFAMLNEASVREQTNRIIANNKAIAKAGGHPVEESEASLGEEVAGGDVAAAPVTAVEQVLLSKEGAVEYKVPRVERTTYQVQTLRTSPETDGNPVTLGFDGTASVGPQFAALVPATGSGGGTQDWKFDSAHLLPLTDPSMQVAWQPEAILEVSNGAGRRHMAARIGQYLVSQGLAVERLTNADHFGYRETTIYYRDGWRAAAMQLMGLLPAGAHMKRVAHQTADIRIELGGDLLEFDRNLYYGQNRSKS